MFSFRMNVDVGAPDPDGESIREVRREMCVG